MRAKTTIFSVALLSACIMGVHGEHVFKETVPAGNMRSITIDLPPTDLHIEGVDGATSIGYEGAWYSTAGNERDARSTASLPKILVNYDGSGAGEIVAHVPLQVENLVDLQLWKLLLPDDLDIEVVGRYDDIGLFNLEGYHFVDVDAGRVEIIGAAAGAHVRTRVGDVDVHSSGAIDVLTNIGDVGIVQTGEGADVVARTRAGSISVTVPSLANVALTVRGPSRVDIRSEALIKVTEGRFEQTLGDGSTIIELSATGDVLLRDATWVDQ